VTTRYNRSYLIFALVAFLVLPFSNELLLTQTLQEWTRTTGGYFAFLGLAGIFTSVRPGRNDLWQYCKIQLEVVKTALETKKESDLHELSALKTNVSIFRSVLFDVNTLSSYFYSNSPLIADPDYFYKALIISHVGNNETWRKRALNGVDVMLKAFTKTNTKIQFNLHQFIRGLNIIAGKRNTFPDMMKHLEFGEGFVAWLRRNSRLIQLGLSIVVTIITLREILPLLLDVFDKLSGFY